MINIMHPKINVLLSTYNGEKYLLEQLHSLYQQTHQNTEIFVRDDGSKDNTVAILQREALDLRLKLFASDKNIGPAASFFELLANCADADYYAFCDQDDVWETEKLSRAIKKLSSVIVDTPVMYFSRLTFVDADNHLIKLSTLPQKPAEFGNALVENIATGCTVVINQAARKLLLKHLPEKCVMHDSWIYLVVSCFGRVIYDEYPSMRYRQHANNAIGTSTNLLDTFLRRVKRFRFKKKALFRYSDQADLLLKYFGHDLPMSREAVLKQVSASHQSIVKRIKLAFSRDIWRQNKFDNLILRVLILLNRY